MNLKNKFSWLSILAGISVWAYDCYWYGFVSYHPSAAISFAFIGLGLVFGGIFLQEFSKMEEQIKKMQGSIDYFEDKLLTEHPELEE